MGSVYVNTTNYLPATGSGYFVRDRNKLFFITAHHVLAGCRSSRDTCKLPVKASIYPDTMNIYLNFQGNMNFRYIRIDVKHIKMEKCLSPPMEADIVACEVINTNNDTIYSVENFLATTLPKKKGVISIYGFPDYANRIAGGFQQVNATHFVVDSFLLYNYYSFKGCDGMMWVDSVDYVLKTYKKRTDNLGGFSGSPVFIEDKKKKKWVFMGTATMVIDDQKLVFTKPEHTLRAIKKINK